MLNYLLIIICCLYTNLVQAQSYQERIQGFLDHNFNYNQIGLIIYSLSNNAILYQHNHNKLFVPASLMKLFTLVASLEELTPKFRFYTKITWNKQQLINNSLHGDIGLIFSGDPEFTDKQLEQLVIAIKKKGIKQIEGSIIVDDTLYSEKYAPGWAIDDLSWGYAAPSTAIVINENKIPIKVSSTYNFGQQVNFSKANSCQNKEQEINNIATNKLNNLTIGDYKTINFNLFDLFNIESKVYAVNHLQATNDCRLNVNVDSNNNIFLSGCVEIDPNEQSINVAINSPRKYLEDLLKFYFNKYNINLLGSIIFESAPLHSSILESCQSSTLVNLLSTMIKNSNNLYANNIGKALGVKLYGHGSFINAAKAIKHTLHKKFTINTGTLNIYDSSGLSVYNVATPNHFIRLLQAIYNDKSLYNIINNILSKPGLIGTLRNRLTAKDLKFKLSAKTGTLKHSSGISGFMHSKSHQELGFTFMINNMIDNDFNTKQLIDELCELLINYI